MALPRRRNRAGSQRARSFADTEPFFAGLELVEPGLVPMAAWRPDPGAEQDPRSVYAYGGVARKP